MDDMIYSMPTDSAYASGKTSPVLLHTSNPTANTPLTDIIDDRQPKPRHRRGERRGYHGSEKAGHDAYLGHGPEGTLPGSVELMWQYQQQLGLPSNNHRIIYIGNLPRGITVEQVLDQVRHGALEHVKFLPEKSCIFLGFLESLAAQAFLRDAKVRPVRFVGRDEQNDEIGEPITSRVNWGRPSPILPTVLSEIIHNGASRNVFLGRISNDWTEGFIRQEMSAFGEIDSVRIIEGRGIAFVHFLSIHSAINAVQTLNAKPEWSDCRVKYGRDRCSPTISHFNSLNSSGVGSTPQFAGPLHSQITSDYAASHSIRHKLNAPVSQIQLQPFYQNELPGQSQHDRLRDQQQIDQRSPAYASPTGDALPGHLMYARPARPITHHLSEAVTQHDIHGLAAYSGNREDFYDAAQRHAASSTYTTMTRPLPVGYTEGLMPRQTMPDALEAAQIKSELSHIVPRDEVISGNFDIERIIGTDGGVEHNEVSGLIGVSATAEYQVDQYGQYRNMDVHAHVPDYHKMEMANTVAEYHRDLATSPLINACHPRISTTSVVEGGSPAGVSSRFPSCNRTVYLGNIHPDTTTEELCNVIRGGILHQIRYMSDKRIAFVSFVSADAALGFYQRAVRGEVVVHQRKLKAGWGKPTPLPGNVIAALQSGATRNVYIGNLPESWAEDKIRADFTEFGDIELVNILRERACGFVNFTNIMSAVKALDGIRVHKDYLKLRVNFGKDRCGNPPRESKKAVAAATAAAIAASSPLGESDGTSQPASDSRSSLPELCYTSDCIASTPRSASYGKSTPVSPTTSSTPSMNSSQSQLPHSVSLPSLSRHQLF